MMKSISVFCGSSNGFDEIYSTEATQLGQKLAERNISLIYGGAKIGLMGAVANGVLEKGGNAIGVLPEFLSIKEVAHENLTQLFIVQTMHERKTKMNELCDGVIAMPGGFGTLEEVFEMLTWAQLSLHKKPIGFLNINGFFDELISFLSKTVEKGFLKKENFDMILVSNNIDNLLDLMKNFVPADVKKWI